MHREFPSLYPLSHSPSSIALCLSLQCRKPQHGYFFIIIIIFFFYLFNIHFPLYAEAALRIGWALSVAVVSFW